MPNSFHARATRRLMESAALALKVNAYDDFRSFAHRQRAAYPISAPPDTLMLNPVI